MSSSKKSGIFLILLLLVIVPLVGYKLLSDSDEEPESTNVEKTKENASGNDVTIIAEDDDVFGETDVLGENIHINETNTMSDTTTTPKESKLDKYSSAPGVLSDELIKNKKSVITTNKGVIEIALFSDEAPLAVSNHVFLANDHFYDGLTFHRREEGFVIQGGDPAGNGTGGPGYSFADEPVSRTYTRGIFAMANAGPDTNGSQFFIMLSDYPLPPNYTIFGEVISGMDVVDHIQIGDTMLKVEIMDR